MYDCLCAEQILDLDVDLQTVLKGLKVVCGFLQTNKLIQGLPSSVTDFPGCFQNAQLQSIMLQDGL